MNPILHNKDLFYNFFDYLDIQEIKSVTLVCKQWNSFIVESNKEFHRFAMGFINSVMSKYLKPLDQKDIQLLGKLHYNISNTPIEWYGFAPSLLDQTASKLVRIGNIKLSSEFSFQAHKEITSNHKFTFRCQEIISTFNHFISHSENYFFSQKEKRQFCGDITQNWLRKGYVKTAMLISIVHSRGNAFNFIDRETNQVFDIIDLLIARKQALKAVEFIYNYHIYKSSTKKMLFKRFFTEWIAKGCHSYHSLSQQSVYKNIYFHIFNEALKEADFPVEMQHIQKTLLQNYDLIALGG